MKKGNLFAALLATILIFSSCKKSDTDCNLIPAKIIRYDCDRVIFHIVTTESIGDTDWEDVQTDNGIVMLYHITIPAKLQSLLMEKK